MKKENLLFFYKSSSGELFAGLPIILEILKQKKDLNPILFYKSDRIDSLSGLYNELIYKNFNVYKITLKNIISFYWKYRKDINYIFTCDGGHNFYSAFFTLISFNSRVVFFHHAYSLLPKTPGPEFKRKIKTYRNFITGFHHYPLVIAHNETEIPYRRELGFLEQNVIVSGNIGYHDEWKKSRRKLEDVQLIEIEKNLYTRTIFIPTIGEHPLALSKENSIYLFNSIKEIIEKFPNYLFLIKLHPRQGEDLKFLNLPNNYKNVFIINFSTITAARISDLVISYHSSAITDALSENTPTIEFFRHDIPHGQLIRTDKGLVSIFHFYGLCPFYQNKEDVLNLLSKPDEWKTFSIGQQEAYRNIFLTVHPDFVTELFNAAKRTPCDKKFIFTIFTFPFYTIKAIIISKIGDLVS